MGKVVTMDSIKQALISGLRDYLPEVEAVGVFGSLARGNFDPKKSDIDVFVVVAKADKETNDIWWRRVEQALSQYDKDITVLVFSLMSLKEISTWHIFRLASEGALLFDKGGIRNLFDQILQAAHKSGLVEKETEEGRKVWTTKKPLKWGEIIDVKVET